MLSVRHGDGAVLVRRPTEERAVEALREHADRIPDIIDAREALEVKLASLAATRRTDADMAAIDQAIATMESEIAAGNHGVVGDEMFHEALTSAARSSLLAKLMHEISGFIKETRIESLSQEGRPRASLEGHRRIAEAVRRRDAQEASRAMADHLRLVPDLAMLRDSDWGVSPDCLDVVRVRMIDAASRTPPRKISAYLS